MSYPLESIDFEQVKERFDAYWRREVPGHPLVGITCPRQGRRPPDFPVPDTVEGRWTDIEYQCNRARRHMQTTVYLGDALPVFTPNLGPDSFSAFLGADLRFLDESTSWVLPCVEDLAQYTPVFDRSNRWWRHMCDLVDAICAVAEGLFLVGVPDLHGGGDALAALRHPDRLALDLYDKPEHIKRLMPDLTAIYKEVFDHYVSRISRVQDGCTTWLRAYSRGTYTALQNDFSGLISPDMFVEFFMPEVRELSGYLDNSLYHLDGPIALGNLPHLLEIAELDGIQWVRGAGSRPMSQWGDVCRQVLDAGKCLHIDCAPEELDYLLRTLPHQGLFVTTSCPNESEGRDLMMHVEDEFGCRR